MVFGRTLVFRSIGLLGVTRCGTTVKKMNPFFSILLAVNFSSRGVIDIRGGARGDGARFCDLLADLGQEPKYEHEEENTPKDWLVVAPLYIPGILSCFAYAVSYIARAWTHYTGNTGLWNPCERDGGGVLLLDACDSL